MSNIDYIIPMNDYYKYNPHFLTLRLINDITATSSYKNFVKKQINNSITMAIIKKYTDEKLFSQLNARQTSPSLKTSSKTLSKLNARHTSNSQSKTRKKLSPRRNRSRRTRRAVGGVGNSMNSINSALNQIKDVLSFVSNTIGDLNTSTSPVKLSPKKISLDDRRLIYLLSIDGQTYYIKIAPKEDGELSREILAKMDITDANLGSYVYEARIYEELNKQMLSTNKSDYITKIYGWGIVDLDEAKYFNIEFKNKKYNLDILENFGLFDAFDYSYMITENDSNYNTLESLINSGKINKKNIDKVYKNGVELLQSCFNKCGFVHWDFHHGNILCNPATNQVKLFDFDLSEMDYVNNKGIKMRSVSWKDDAYGVYLDILEKKNKYNMSVSDIGKYAGKCYDYYRFMSERPPYEKIHMDMTECLGEGLSKFNILKCHTHLDHFNNMLCYSVLKYKDKC